MWNTLPQMAVVVFICICIFFLIKKQSITENCLSYGDLSEQEQKIWPLLPDSQTSGVLNYS